MAKPLEVVELRVDSGRWEAGTVGTIVEVLGDEGVLVEIVDDQGRTQDVLPLPHGTFRIIESPDQAQQVVSGSQ